MFPHLSLAAAQRFAPRAAANLSGLMKVRGKAIMMFCNFRTVSPIAAFAVGLSLGVSPALATPSPKDVLKTYADIGQAAYSDCHRCFPRQPD
jgi:uncharacterized iron-regulated protein